MRLHPSRILLLLLLVAAGVGLWWAVTPRPIGRHQLKNGTFLVLWAVTPAGEQYGPQPVWSGLLDRLSTSPPRSGQAPRSGLAVWTSLQDPKGRSIIRGKAAVQQWDGPVRVKDEHGCRFDRRGWEHAGGQSRPTTGVLATYPRRASILELTLLRPGGEEAATFAVPRRAETATAAALKAVPEARTEGQRVVARKLTTGLSWAQICASDPPFPSADRRAMEQGWDVLRSRLKATARPQDLTWSRLDFNSTSGKAPAVGWWLERLKVRDGTGNSTVFVAGLDLARGRLGLSGKGWAAFPDALCTREDLWSLSLEFAYHGSLSQPAPLQARVDPMALPMEGGARHATRDLRGSGAVLRLLGITGRGGSMTAEPRELRKSPRVVFELPQKDTPQMTVRVRAREVGGVWYDCPRATVQEVNGRPTLAYALRPVTPGREIQLDVAAWPGRTFAVTVAPERRGG